MRSCSRCLPSLLFLLWRILLGVLVGSISLMFYFGLTILFEGRELSYFLDPLLRPSLVTAVVMSWVVGGLVGLFWGIYSWLVSRKNTDRGEKGDSASLST